MTGDDARLIGARLDEIRDRLDRIADSLDRLANPPRLLAKFGEGGEVESIEEIGEADPFPGGLPEPDVDPVPTPRTLPERDTRGGPHS